MPYNKKVADKIRNMIPITRIFSRNDIDIIRDVNGRIKRVTIDDGDNSKIMTITRDATGKISSVTTV